MAASTARLSFRIFVIGLACLLAIACSETSRDEVENGGARSTPAVDQTNFLTDYDHAQVMIPMRDGVQLFTNIHRPKNSGEPLPFLILRTPYDATLPPDNRYGPALSGMAEEGYIFVWQDIRGKYGSEGDFVMIRPPADAQDPTAIDEGTDAYDTIDWLVNNIPGNNGRAGVWGISYAGWTTAMALIDPHPALKAASPQASPSDMFMGDDFLHNGAIRLSSVFGYAALVERSNVSEPFQFENRDVYEWYLGLGPLATLNDLYIDDASPTWNAAVRAPNYSDHWREQEVTQYLELKGVPVLNVAGWFDAEDFYGPIKIYEKFEQDDSEGLNSIVVGPWSHGGWVPAAANIGAPSTLGSIEFDVDTQDDFLNRMMAPFFAYHLKDKGVADMPEAQVFETGGNQWRSLDAWPPQSATPRRLYFHEAGALSFQPPEISVTAEADRYLSDPAKPVPYTPRPISGFWQHPQAKALWKVEDQRFASARPDVLTYRTEPLSEDLVLGGEAIARIFASTTGSDADWIVKLIDVYPDDYGVADLAADASEQDQAAGQATRDAMGGYQMMLTSEIFPSRYRNGFESAEALTPGEVAAYEINLGGRLHRFKKGHRIMVQVQSTMFPLFARNPQTFVAIPEEARAEDFVAATHAVYRSGEWLSHIELPVLSGDQ